MIVVADTSPIHYLILLRHIEILPAIFGEVQLPQTVFEELQDRDAPAEIRAWLTTLPEWLKINYTRYAPDPRLDRLDRGEHDAILLAESMHADRLIMDDLDGRREAENRNLPVIGTLGILAEASRRKLINLPETLIALQATNFYVSPALLKLMLAIDASSREI